MINYIINHFFILKCKWKCNYKCNYKYMMYFVHETYNVLYTSFGKNAIIL